MARVERFISLICYVIAQRSKQALFFVLLLVSFSCYSQNIVNSPLLRFPIWFVLDESPSLSSPLVQGESVFSPATESIRDLSPFFVEALVYGWEFSYTPYDAVRGVNEYFEIKNIISIDAGDPNLHYTDSVVADDTTIVESWIEYELTKRMVYERHRWHSASYPSIKGKGEGSVFDGTEGVKDACEDAAKEAIRSYARDIIKNKPKEITGKVLLTDFPRYYIDAGKYVADLDFFLNVSTIVEYTTF